MQYFIAFEAVLEVTSAKYWIKKRLMVGFAKLAFDFCVGCSSVRICVRDPKLDSTTCPPSRSIRGIRPVSARLLQVPARDLAHDVVQRGLEARRGLARDLRRRTALGPGSQGTQLQRRPLLFVRACTVQPELVPSKFQSWLYLLFDPT